MATMDQSHKYCKKCQEQSLHARPGTNHLLHAFLTFFLCGFWLPVWILASIRIGGWRCQTCGYGGSTLLRFGPPVLALGGFLLVLSIVVASLDMSSPVAATTPGRDSSSDTAAPDVATAKPVYDVPSLIGKTIDEIRSTLGKPLDSEIEPSELQLDTGVDQWENVFEKNGCQLLVTFDPRTRKVVDFFLEGNKQESVLRIGQLSADATDYRIEYVKAIRDPSAITGVKAIPTPKVVVREPAPKVPTVRTWTDATGRYKTEGTFAGVESGKVKLIKADGTSINLPLEKLSQEDRQWIKNQGN
ncbi:MAG: hypothetical protein JW888_00705 [Pirellulales bacterium]|nr:hypothetical protein [Pirellulales bacterium]